MSDTPISDAAAFDALNYDQPVVPLYLSQNLERQLAESRDTVCKMEMAIQYHERQLAEVTKQRDALAEALKASDFYMREHGIKLPNAVREKNRSALANLKGDKP